MFCVDGGGGGLRGLGLGGMGVEEVLVDLGRCDVGGGLCVELGGGLGRGGMGRDLDTFRRSYSALKPLAHASLSSWRLADSSKEIFGSTLLPHAS